MQIEFPAPLQCLFQPRRYKVLYGGRGAGRSWGVARALLLIGVQKATRILCARELQNSIGESVHQLLKDQIYLMGLEKEYEIQEQVIYHRTNGTQFRFAGIKNNYTKIKSFEGIDIVWVEEANKVSKNSWTALIPTIRKKGSEIWMSFNPELEDDYTFDYFVKHANTDPLNGDAYVVKMTWRDNPWITEELLAEKDKLRRVDFDLYMNVWEGHCLETLEGTVYVKEMREAIAAGRIMEVPWLKTVPVNTYWDLGRADATAIWFIQKVAMQYRVLHYYQATGEDIVHFLRYLQQRQYLYGTHYLPHDAGHKRLIVKDSIEDIVKKAYPGQVKVLEKTGISDGINAARMIFGNCYFNEEECLDGIRALKAYRYKVVDGQRGNTPVHDWASDGADAFRGFAMAQKLPKDINDGVAQRMAIAKQNSNKKIMALGQHAWMG